jgi:hypothetical protein
VSVDGSLDISTQAALTSLDLSALDNVAGDISFRSNAQLLDLALPSFGSSGADGDEGTLFTVEQNDALLNLLLPSVVTTGRSFMIGGVNAQNANPALRRIDLSNLEACEVRTRALAVRCAAAAALLCAPVSSAGSLTTGWAQGYMRFSGIPAVDELELDALERVGDHFYIGACVQAVFIFCVGSPRLLPPRSCGRPQTLAYACVHGGSVIWEA